MKIISKFKDYYDYLLKFGQDDDLQYVRITEEVDIKSSDIVFEYTKPMRAMHGITPQGIEVGLVFFCNRAYFVMAEMSLGKVVSASYDSTSIVDAFAKEYPNYFKPSWWRFHKTLYELREELKNGNFISIPEEVFRSVGSPVFLLRFSPLSYRKDEYQVVKNPCLKDYDFIKALPAEQAYQELFMFLANNTLQEPKPVVELTDKEEIVKKGFDLKTSFRKQKQK